MYVFSLLNTLREIEFSLSILNYNYLGKEEFSTLILQTLNEIISELVEKENIDDDFFKINKEKNLILEVLNNMFYDKNYNRSISPNEIENKKIIEETLSLISEQLKNKDYSYPSNNDYSYITKKKTHHEIDTKLLVSSIHNKTYNYIESKGLDIWTDYKDSKLYWRTNAFEDKKRTTKAELIDFLYSSYKFDIEIFNNMKDVKDINSNYLVLSLLPVVKMEIFDPFTNDEFPHIINNMFYKNKFQYTEHLNNRAKQATTFKQSIIVDFIRALSKDETVYLYNVLAFFLF